MFHHRWGGELVRTLPYSGEADLKWEERLAILPTAATSWRRPDT